MCRPAFVLAGGMCKLSVQIDHAGQVYCRLLGYKVWLFLPSGSLSFLQLHIYISVRMPIPSSCLYSSGFRTMLTSGQSSNSNQFRTEHLPPTTTTPTCLLCPPVPTPARLPSRRASLAAWWSLLPPVVAYELSCPLGSLEIGLSCETSASM